jgi:hypothetical protein
MAAIVFQGLLNALPMHGSPLRFLAQETGISGFQYA